jgi:hypothetical protein
MLLNAHRGSIKQLLELAGAVKHSKNMHGIWQYVVKNEVITLDNSSRVFTKLGLVLAQERLTSQRLNSMVNLFKQSRGSAWIVGRDIPPNSNEVFLGLRGSN